MRCAAVGGGGESGAGGGACACACAAAAAWETTAATAAAVPVARAATTTAEAQPAVTAAAAWATTEAWAAAWAVAWAAAAATMTAETAAAAAAGAAAPPGRSGNLSRKQARVGEQDREQMKRDADAKHRGLPYGGTLKDQALVAQEEAANVERKYEQQLLVAMESLTQNGNAQQRVITILVSLYAGRRYTTSLSAPLPTSAHHTHPAHHTPSLHVPSDRRLHRISRACRYSPTRWRSTTCCKQRRKP